MAIKRGWDIPPITTPGALAGWLALSIGEMEWFAELKQLGYKNNAPRLRHYWYRVTSKRSGAIRLLEAPKPRLKELQQKILSGILQNIPSHPAAHGFVRGRSIKTFVAPHTGQRVVLRMDVRDFFPSFTAARIRAFFQTIGYPEAVAGLLSGICTNAAPRDIWRTPPFDIGPCQIQEARAIYGRPHLPQGAPSSPALANVCFYRMDRRLAGLAKSATAEYTRYADDLAFSGDDIFERNVERFSTHVSAILLEEGFTTHYRKTRIMRQGVRQHLTGLVVNERMNIVRRDFDRLKATLTNCVRLGPESQNRESHYDFRSHLEGRVGFVETIHPARGKRLREILNRIQWA
jgi:retron-type reverse transcriptase